MAHPDLIIDTSIIIDHLRKRNKRKSILFHIVDVYTLHTPVIVEFETLHTPVIVEFELLPGRSILRSAETSRSTPSTSNGSTI